MHRLAATPGGWNPQSEGVIFIEQTPAPIILLTAADTDIQTLAAAISTLPHSVPANSPLSPRNGENTKKKIVNGEDLEIDNFPLVRVVNLLQLQQQLSIDTYAEDVLESARVIIVRLLGGRSYWSYGLEVVRETAARTNAALIVLPGDDRPEPELISHSNVSLSAANQLWRYFTEGGVENFVNALKFVANLWLEKDYNPAPPQQVPRVGLYPCKRGRKQENNQYKIGLLFYRAHYLAGNTAPIDALCQSLAERNLEPVPVFVSSLRDVEVQAELLQYFQPKDSEPIQLLINTTSFSIANPIFGFGIANEKVEFNDSKFNALPPLIKSNENLKLDVPTLQVILSGGTLEQWESGFQGLSPRDMAMNVALPEVDGRIITRAVSFKAIQARNSQLETDVVVYEPASDRISFVADLAANWVRLRQTPPSQRRIALILANYPTRDGRLANGVGLDTPASCVEILNALQEAGYQLENIPATGEELIARLTSGVTNDPEGQELRTIRNFVSQEEYQQYFATLPDEVQKKICDRWGIFLETNPPRAEKTEKDGRYFAISGIQLGNVFVGIQPARGYDIDPSLNYHAPDLEPPHNYLAFYYWVRQKFGSDAIVHVGKHGNLEWLPGKSVALSSNCYPEVTLGALPHFYPFIVNDPGEGSQAKRRAQAVIIDHLTPPMTRAELYGPLQQLEGLIDEYYEAQSLDPSRLSAISDRIAQLVLQENLHQDLGVDLEDGEDIESTKFLIQNPESKIKSFLAVADGYLCELKEAQIRDGLHIFGQCPQGRQLRDLIVAIARHPGNGRLGLTRAIAQDCGWDFDPLTTDFGLPISGFRLGNIDDNTQFSIIEDQPDNPKSKIQNLKSIGDGVELLEQQAANLVEQLIHNPEFTIQNPKSKIACELNWIRDRLLPSLLQTNQEITNLLLGLDGRFVPPGASGAPTRGRPEVLPTGRNFYSVDIRAIPTETAWLVGRKAADALIERYVQDNGEYPKTLAISVWGTSTMRTGGDDLAQSLWLLGVQPVWDGLSRRVVDFEILPVSVLGRPRVDVTLRISGFFRDAFANLIDLFDKAVAAVAALDESEEENPLAARVKKETEYWQGVGVSKEEAKMRSRYRIFGSKPGAYGAGLQGLIEAQNWTDDEDLARAYINWSSYAYTSAETNGREPSSSPLAGGLGGVAAPEAFEQRLRQMQIVLHNQDNREHDLLDSDDYYQFQGGLTAAVRGLTGKNPHTYFGDNSIPQNPKVRQLKEEIARVYRSRVVNPKWIAGVMRHGYKGAFEMAATVDYLFAYDATANCVEDFMYAGVAEAYLFAPDVQEFIQQKNPWALRDMAERLLEANQRGLWQGVDEEMVEKLRAIAHQAEAVIEGFS
ncbi:cobaltochelatase subunit CobN [Microcoleus sp. FACHB-831]|uniref:cobaltochelatase subunit CobN n=1 Tax=Microcoleus sp. FACHB-831 TaxID=2692827 RepID=UPI0016820EBE|nr:cobaltochelatase subunit CobN [Microcoleus sp. FACHB-831]MBD1923303.1 cobaltochelatase subunit CobN [Microcoleus sp. FACHB-831]